jgi:hypothetical protein
MASGSTAMLTPLLRRLRVVPSHGPLPRRNHGGSGRLLCVEIQRTRLHDAQAPACPRSSARCNSATVFQTFSSGRSNALIEADGAVKGLNQSNPKRGG